MRRVLVVLLLPLLAACGSATTTPGAAGPTTSSPSSSASTPSPVPPSAAEPTGLTAGDDSTWTPWAKGGPAPTDLSAATSPVFVTSDGSLRCHVDPFETGRSTATVVCLRREGLGVDQPRPVDCTGTWGDAVAASPRGGGRLVCVEPSDAEQLDALAPAETVADGEAVTYDGLTCAVRADAVQCLSSDARGFVVSRRAIVVR